MTHIYCRSQWREILSVSLDFLTKSDHREADVRFVSHMYDSNQQIFRNGFYYKN